jgi:tetratricopeptide (TPR) repeat protein
VSRARFLLACAAAVALFLAAYANSLHNSFHFDDSHVIENNLYLRSLSYLPRYFTDAHTFSSLPQNATYRPLVTLSLALDYARGGGLDPHAFHVTQIVLMLVTGALLFFFFLPIMKRGARDVVREGEREAASGERLAMGGQRETAGTTDSEQRATNDERQTANKRTANKRISEIPPIARPAPAEDAWPYFAALFAATLFCVHTANTETMNLISARSELLSTIWLLGTFILYQRFVFAPERRAPSGLPPAARHLPRAILCLIPLAIGALAKAPLVVFAPLLFLYAMYFEGQPPRRALRTALPSLIVGIALLVFLNAMNAKEWVGGGGSALHYAITQPFIWLHYARLFFLPMGLTADTDWQPFAQWYDTRAVAGYAFVVLLLVAIRRARGPVAFGLAWFAIALIPTSLFPLAEVANEHRIFFAYIGAVLALTAALPRRALAPVAIVLLLANAIGTHVRNEAWATEETLWGDVIVKSPGNGRAWMNYGLTRMAKGDYAAAKASFDHAALLTPNYSILEINQGVVSGAMGDTKSAEAHFLRALVLNSDANAHYFYARWLVEQGRAAEAMPHVRAAIAQSPAFADANDLGARLDIALGFRRGRAWNDYSGAFQAGLTALQHSDWLAAAEANRDALRHDPRSADAWNNLGWSLARLGFTAEARHAYESALSLRPEDARAKNNR